MKTTSMKKTELGEQPAFPFNEIELTTYSGLTKREMFAMAAMQGLVTNNFSPYGFQNGDEHDLSLIAVRCADALLKELEK